VSDGSPDGQGSQQRPGAAGGPQNIATAIADVSERFATLVHEEIELAKAEVAEKTTKLAKGAIVAVAAGVFLVTALFFVLIGLAFLLYYVFPVNAFAYFWGFFAMALILIVLGALAGLVAAKVVKRGAPPTPQMAIDEARKIRESISAGADAGAQGVSAGAAGSVVGSSPADVQGTPGSASIAGPAGAR
jgi:uncharacterized membrane protein YqjE